MRFILKYFRICKIYLSLGMAKKIKTGRKKIDPSEKVILVGFYTKRKIVENAGGMEQAREFVKTTLEGKYA